MTRSNLVAHVGRENPLPLDAIDPAHYRTSTVEPIDAIEAWKLGFNLGNAVKYIARAGHKGDRRSDLIKAANYAYREATGKWLPKDLIEGE